MRTLLLPFALCLVAAPVCAQHVGSVNRKAPTATHSLKYANGNQITIQYKSITIAGGKTMKTLADPEKGAGYRNYVNKKAKDNPLGSLNTSVALNVAGKHVAPGEYKLSFTIDDDLAWHLNLTHGDKTISWKLKTNAPKSDASRLCMFVEAGKTEKQGTLSVAFGNLSTRIGVEMGAKKGEHDHEHGKEGKDHDHGKEGKEEPRRPSVRRRIR